MHKKRAIRIRPLITQKYKNLKMSLKISFLFTVFMLSLKLVKYLRKPQIFTDFRYFFTDFRYFFKDFTYISTHFEYFFTHFN